VIHTNLATRPFYNERAVWLVVLAIGLLGVAATVFNVSQVIRLSRQDTRLATQAASDEARATDLRTRAARLRATVDPHILETASADARQANDLIDRRTFSWTELFNRLEKTLPDEARITTVRPKLDAKRGIVVAIVVAARSVDDVNQFVDKLDATGAFADLQKLGETVDDDNEIQSTLEGVYTAVRADLPADHKAEQ
jgi:Tfp pilus assembly protein PilN